jgi:hypothetical protein
MDIIAELKKERDKVQRQLAGSALAAFAGVYGKKTEQADPTEYPQQAALASQPQLVPGGLE